MDYKDLLSRRNLQLTSTETKMVGVLLSNPTLAPYYSATKLAEEAGVCPSAAVRFAKRLGYTGYAQFREALLSETIKASEPVKRMTKRLEKSDSNEILAKLVEDEILALSEIKNYINQDQIEMVAQTLSVARCVYIFAQGNSIALQDMLDRRLRRAGLQTVLLSGQCREIAEGLLAVQRTDVLLAFAFHAEPPGLAITYEEFKNVRARTIMISDSKRNLNPYKSSLQLIAPRGEESEFQSLTIPMAICNAVVLTLAKLDGGKTLKSLERLGTIIQSE
jgi:DNA-binding MurR/RpiR family transcriptional regulator